MVTWGVLGVETLGNRGKWGRGTYSTCLDQEGGSLMVMNTQLVRMVIIMNMLNSVGGRVKESEGAGGEERRTEGLLTQSASSPRAPHSCPSLTPACLSPPLCSPHSARI